MGFDFMFNVFPIIFSIMFLLVLGFFITYAVKGIQQWNKNNKSPVLTVDAFVVTKRMAVSHHHHHHHQGNAHAGRFHHSSTTYYVTFEVESGDRFELSVPDNEYGLLAEGDSGRLTFQGTRYKSFERY